MPVSKPAARLASALVAAALAAPAGARDLPSSPLISAIAACQSIADDGQRLACFDRASKPLTEGVKAGTLSVVGQEEIKEAKRSLFGFSLPKLKIFGSDGEELDELVTSAKSVSRSGYDRWRIRIADGDAVWETLEEPRVEPRAGDKIVLKKGVVGNAFMKINGANGVRARRVQ